MRKIFSALICLIGIATLCFFLFIKPISSVYKVATPILPEKIDPRSNILTVYDYIFAQLYYPLISFDESGNFESKFLDTKSTIALDDSFISYRMCLKPNLLFSDGSDITLDDFISSIRETHNTLKELENIKKIESTGQNCIKIELKKSDPFYFKKLANINSTILKTGVSRIPVGIGPYRISSSDSNKIILVENQNEVTGDIKKVEFIRVDTKISPDNDIDDWNLFFNQKFPEKIINEWQKVERPILKTYGLLVKIEDKNLRKLVASCFPREEFIKAIGMNLRKVPGLLPMGIMGWQVPFNPPILKKCSFVGKKPKFDFLNYISENQKPLEIFVKKHENTLPIELDLRFVTAGEYVKKALSKNQMLVVIGVAAPIGRLYATYEGFFEVFTQNSFFAGSIDNLAKTVHDARNEPILKKRVALIEKVHRITLDSYYFIPFGQFVHEQYYPRDIRNITFQYKFHQIPRIDRMKRRYFFFDI